MAYPENYVDHDGYLGTVELVPSSHFSDEYYGPNHPDWVEYINQLIEKGREFQRSKHAAAIPGGRQTGSSI